MKRPSRLWPPLAGAAILLAASVAYSGCSWASRNESASTRGGRPVPTASFSETMPVRPSAYPRMKGTLRIAIPDYAVAAGDLRMRLSFDFARHLAWTMGMYPEFVPAAFSGERAENPALPGGVFDKVLRRRADIGLTGEYYGPPDAAGRVFSGLVFSRPYYDQGPFLTVLRSSRVRSVLDLRGSRVETDGFEDAALRRLVPGVVLGRPRARGGQDLLKTKLADLRSGRVAAVTVSSDEYLSAWTEQDLSDIKVIAPTIMPQRVSVALRKDSRLRENVDEAIRSMEERGVLRGLQLKWHFPAVYP